MVQFCENTLCNDPLSVFVLQFKNECWMSNVLKAGRRQGNESALSCACFPLTALFMALCPLRDVLTARVLKALQMC